MMTLGLSQRRRGFSSLGSPVAAPQNDDQFGCLGSPLYITCGVDGLDPTCATQVDEAFALPPPPQLLRLPSCKTPLRRLGRLPFQQPQKSLKDSTRQFGLPCAEPPHHTPALPGPVAQQKRQVVPLAPENLRDPPVSIGDEERATSDVGDSASFADSFDSENHSEGTHMATPVRAPDSKVAGPQTTLMIRNVPVMYTQEMLVAEWPNANDYDFLYLPRGSSMQRNLSYAFINFLTESAAVDFAARWQKKRLAHFSSRKPLNISVADVQGRVENLRRLRMNRATKAQYQPLIFEHGTRVQLDDGAESLELAAKNATLDDRITTPEAPLLPMSCDPLSDEYVLERFSL